MVGNLVALVVASFALGVVGRLVAGVGTGIGFIAGSDYVRATVGTASAQGLYGAAGVAGGGLAIAIVPLTTPALDWRAPYVTALIFAFAVLVCLPLAPRDRPSRERRRNSARVATADIVRDLGHTPVGASGGSGSARSRFTFALPGHGRVGFAAIAGLWALACLAVRPSKLSALEPDGPGPRLPS
jgi:MFS family permease